MLNALYDISDDRHLPGCVVRRLACGMSRAHVTAWETETVVDRATDAKVLELLRACRSARDRFIVMAIAKAGLRAVK